MLPDNNNSQTPETLGRAVSGANDQPYALAKLGEATRIIKQSINDLPLVT